MRSPGGNSIVLKAGRQKKIWLVGVSVLFIVLGLVLVSFAPGSAMGVLAFIGFFLVIVIVGGLVDTSKGARITLTVASISGGTLRRKTIPWDQLGDVWVGDETVEWESSDSSGSKATSCQTPYGPMGRECLHNGRTVSLELAIEWIEALRDASSEEERAELLRKFRGAAPKILRSLNQLTTEERAKAQQLLSEIKNLGGDYSFDRRMEVRQYFKEKGWAFPKQNVSTTKVAIGWFLIIATVIFWIFFFSLLT
jgi:hypothetical protein